MPSAVNIYANVCCEGSGWRGFKKRVQAPLCRGVVRRVVRVRQFEGVLIGRCPSGGVYRARL